jgi:hypothetical protein
MAWLLLFPNMGKITNAHLACYAEITPPLPLSPLSAFIDVATEKKNTGRKKTTTVECRVAL